ncbi:PREDICTED: uncharacterized protein LOC107185358 [Dufourea novaeangliae]|nr:PREDICTED: uncharacterized protein LOC107185358 [Dufourea novaeangliae]
MMNALIVLLGFLAAAHAVPAYIPDGKEVEYTYTIDVKSGLMEPAEFASYFGIDCILRVRQYTNDPVLKNAYYVKLMEVKHKLFTGLAQHDNHPGVKPLRLDDVARVIESPFVIGFDENGRLKCMKWVNKEEAWSKNIKRSIASMLQLDMVNIFKETPMETHSFITPENTIHGTCQVAYNVQPMQDSNKMVVTKIHDPMNCTNFNYRKYNNIEHGVCQVAEEDGMTTASRRVFDIENTGNGILIKKLVAHAVINYFPWLSRAEAHYLLTNQTLIFNQIVAPQPLVELQTSVPIPVDTDITFSQPTEHYAVTGDLDVTQGRHEVKLENLQIKLKKLLDEAAGYLKENHIHKKEPEWKHGQTINRILYIMSYMNLKSLEEVHNDIRTPKDNKEEAMRNIFLSMVPEVGTVAGCLFTRNVVRQKTVSDLTAASMLMKLPMNLKHPQESLLKDMEELLHYGDSVSYEVRKAAILCFSTLLRKTYHDGTVTPVLKEHLRHFMDGLLNDPSHEIKVVHLMALRNVHVTEILHLLEPIIRGEKKIPILPDVMRMEAIWAIRDVAADLPEYSYRLLWPIFSNVNLPIQLRTVAYEVLMNQCPSRGMLINMYWVMVYEKNMHLYNYHVDTLKGFAGSENPCLLPVQEMVRKILRFTRQRSVSGPLSGKFHVESHDHIFGHGEGLKVSLIRDDVGLPSIGSLDHFTSVARKPANRWGIHWHIDGLPEMLNDINVDIFGSTIHEITSQHVKNLLNTVTKEPKIWNDINAHLMLTWNDKVFMVWHCDKNNWEKVVHDLVWWWNSLVNRDHSVHQQFVLFDDNYEQHVATDFGVPAVLSTKTPVLDSLKLNTVVTREGNNIKMQLKMKYQEWKHGEYFMTIYNPFADVWHGVRRTGTRDVVIAFDWNIVYNNVSKGIKVTSARLPTTEYSVTGLLTQAKNYVTVLGDENGALTDSCPSCFHIQNVTGTINRKVHEVDVDSVDTALHFNLGIYNCEGYSTPLPLAAWLQVLSADRDTYADLTKLAQLVIRLRQKVKNDMISSHRASCTNMILVEPSITHLATQVEYSTKFNVEKPSCDEQEILDPVKIDIRGTMDVKSHPTNVSINHWDANVNIMLSPGHTNNHVKVMLTRMVPGEKNYKICIDGQKDYPHIHDEQDLLDVTNTKKETTTMITILSGHTTHNRCDRGETDITVLIKGEDAVDPTDHKVHDHLKHTCQRDTEISALQTEEDHIPKTWACIQNAMIHMTLRKYTIDIVPKKMPKIVGVWAHITQDVVRAIFPSHLHFTSELAPEGTAKIILDYSIPLPKLDVTVNRDCHTYQLLQLPFGHNVWHMLMDNVHFSAPAMLQIVNERSKICTVHPQVTLAFNNMSKPVTVPSEWTPVVTPIASEKKLFTLFTKSMPNNRLAILFAVGDHKIQIEHGDSNVIVTVDDKVIQDPRNGIVVPPNSANSYTLKLSRGYKHWAIQTTKVPISIFYTPNSISVLLSADYQGHVQGLCGSMNSHSHVQMALIS